MSEILCMFCKTAVNKSYNINETYAKYSNSSLRTLLENVFEFNIILPNDLYLCSNCNELIDQLDYAEVSYKTIKQTVREQFGINQYVSRKVDVYCQTNDISAETCKIENEIKAEEHICNVCFKTFISSKGVTLHVKEEDSDILNALEKHVETAQMPEDSTLNIDVDNFLKIVKDSSDTECDSKEFQKCNRGRKSKYPDVLKPYECNSCLKTWKTQGELKSHIISHSDERPFICEICGQTYKRETALNIHVGMHNGVNPFTCTYCNKSFTQKGALRRHLPIHTGECKHQCDLCGKRFVHHTSFNIHQLSHSGQKDYKCGQCGLALLSSSHLKRHMRVHTGEKKFICNLCGKHFAERYNLMSHQKLHTEKAPNTTYKRNHRCHICGVMFARRIKLQEHINNKHQNIDPNVSFIQQLLTAKPASETNIVILQ